MIRYQGPLTYLLYINDAAVAVLPIGTTEEEAMTALNKLKQAIQNRRRPEGLYSEPIAHLKEAPTIDPLADPVTPY